MYVIKSKPEPPLAKVVLASIPAVIRDKSFSQMWLDDYTVLEQSHDSMLRKDCISLCTRIPYARIAHVAVVKNWKREVLERSCVKSSGICICDKCISRYKLKSKK